MDGTENGEFNIAILIHQIGNAGISVITGSIGSPKIERPCQLCVEAWNDNIQFVIWGNDRLEPVF